MELPVAIGIAARSGKLIFGERAGKKAALKGKVRAVILSKNCHPHIAEEIKGICKIAEIPFFIAAQTSLELGSVCGKPFSISVLSVIEEGDSDIVKSIKGRK